jgi:hypothetical protein
MLVRSREGTGEHFEELTEPQPGTGARGDHRVEGAAADGGLQVVDQQVDVENGTGL